MSRPDPPRIHLTAIISAEVELADDVRVGPYVVIDGPVTVGPGCVIGPHAHLIGPLTLGTLGKGEWRHLTRDEVRALGERVRNA